MRRSAVFAVLAAVALIGVLVWVGVRDNEVAPTATPDAVEVARPEVTRADTRVSRPVVALPGTIHGTVIRGGGEGAATGHEVELLRDERVVARATTDGTGEFAFRSVEPGAVHEVRVAADGCRTVRITGLTLLPSERRDVGELWLYPPRVVRVEVTDEHGTPIPGVVVDVFRERSGALAQHAVGRSGPPPNAIQSVQVDEQGKGELHLGYGARHAVVAHAPGYAQAALAQVEIALVEVREAPLRLVL